MKFLLRFFALPLFLSALACGGTAQTSATKKSQDEPVNPVSAYGSISGSVGGEDGPMPYATITVSPVGGRSRGNSSRTVTSDGEGHFKVDGLKAVAWNVTATAPGYVSEELPGEETNGRFHQIGENVTIRMVKGGVITGRVLTAAGEPVIAVRVNAQMLRDLSGRPATGATAVGDFQTDDRGVYRIYGLRAGIYIVVASPSSNAPNNFRPGLYDGDIPIYYPAGTRDTAAEVTVNSGAETAGIDIQYRSEKGRVISGTIAGAASEEGMGGGFTSVTLTYAATGVEFNRAFIRQRGPGGPGTTTRSAMDKEAFAVSGVPDGQYELTAYRNSPNGDAAASPPRAVLVSGRDVTGIELVLKPLASIAARLQLESGDKCEGKRKPSFEEQVFALRPDEGKDPKPVRGALRPSAPNRAGELVFRELTAGIYRFAPTLLDETLFIRSITAPAPGPVKTATKSLGKPSPLDVGKNGLSLKSGERLTGVTVTLAGGAAAVQGQVKAAGETTLPSLLTVHLIPVEREKADDVLRYAEIRTAEAGKFSLNNLMPGRYWILVRPTSDSIVKPASWISADRIKLRKEAEAATQILELSPCQRLANYEVVFRNAP